MSSPSAERDPTPAPPTDAGAALEAVRPEAGVGLCLSGGGYRAMLFHLGSLWRLNDAGLLPGLACVSSVSGGSITAAVLALHWRELDFGPGQVARRFISAVVEPVRALARHTIDIGAIVGGLLDPFGTVAGRVAQAYRQHLFGRHTLQDLPDEPRFVLNATNVQTGALWRFTKAYMGDYRVGLVRRPRVELAVAVAASSAFPPFLSPVSLRLNPRDVQPEPGTDLHRPPFTTRAVLSDGGVYDNLGLEPVFKRYEVVLVGDGGAEIAAEEDPAVDWARHSRRVVDLLDNQVRALRKRLLIAAYRDGSRRGGYWGILTDIRAYQLADALDCPREATVALAELPTRLARLADGLQERLINWGFAVCDAALRKHYLPELARPEGFPYPRGV